MLFGERMLEIENKQLLARQPGSTLEQKAVREGSRNTFHVKRHFFKLCLFSYEITDI